MSQVRSSRRSAAALPLDAFDIAPDEVRARIAWAVNRGQPQWLWPDVEPASWTTALERIAAVTGELLAHGQSDIPLEGNTVATGLAGYTSGMGPLLGYWLESGKIRASPRVAAILDLHLRHNRLRMERMTARASLVSKVLSDAGVVHARLKGMHTAFRYFPEPGTRPLSDMDLLIAPADERRAGEALQAAGFQQEGARDWPPERWWGLADAPKEPRSLCFVHADDPWVVDVHTSLNRRYAAGSPIVRLDDAIGEVLSPAAGYLPQPLLLLHLAVHASCGLESLSMIRIVELALIARADFGTDADLWNAFLNAAARSGALGCAYPALSLCEKLAPRTVPTAILDRMRRDVPAAVQRVVDPLSPANAQRVLRSSLAEHFMWASGPLMVFRQIADEIVPRGSLTFPALLAFCRTRARRLMRATLVEARPVRETGSPRASHHNA